MNRAFFKGAGVSVGAILPHGAVWVFAFLGVMALAALAPAVYGQNAVRAPSGAIINGPIRSFGAPSSLMAWLQTDSSLLITDDEGASWRDATPAGVALGGGASVTFLDANTGWLAALTPDTPGAITLAVTQDGGRSWQEQTRHLFSAADPGGNASELSMFWLDRRTGWLVVRQSTSSNFNRGALFATQDGGATWQRLALPGGDAVSFISANEGWTAGGPNGDTWHRTVDGGRTWTVVSLPYPVQVEPGQRRHSLPHFTADGQHGVVAVATSVDAQSVQWYATHDRGATWTLVDGLPVLPGTARPLAEVDAAAWLMAETHQPLLQPAAPAPFFANPSVVDERESFALAALLMASPRDGWATDGRGARLLHTEDGGQRWRVVLSADIPLTLPASTLERPVSAAGAVGDERTARLKGPGFDACELPGEENLRRWMEAGPYRAVNLYIGGNLRACANSLMDAPRLIALARQGWTFIPTWVGPQAPCTDFRSRFDVDPSVAFSQGRAEAAAALSVAQQLGLADAGGAGSVIYYDLEAYDGSDAGCVEASRAFIAGWTQRIQEGGSFAGLYALACNPPIGSYADLSPVLDVVWFAAWIRGSFDPNVNPGGISARCLAPTLWNQQQRIWQYAGSHDETWGGVTLEIDSNAVDGIVADLSSVAGLVATVIMETPKISPAYDEVNACEDGWHRLTNVRGQPAYLSTSQVAGATIPPLNHALWRPTLPITGTYSVEALIPGHGSIEWPCREESEPWGPDTSRARYIVYHAGGETTVVGDQLPYSNDWLRLGSYPFKAGDSGVVYLDAAVEDSPRLVSFSAMRFTLELEGALPEEVHLPIIRR